MQHQMEWQYLKMAMIVDDNAAIHRYHGGQAVASWLNDMGIAVVYTPVRSPEFNVAELVFNKIKP